jgi:fructan beta-fructosidase
MKIIWTGLLCLFTLFQAAHAQELSTVFKAAKRYLVLPVKNGAPKHNVELWVDGEKERYLNIELADGEPDWLAYLDISAWKGMEH